ncbi:MAG: hypothetical protein ACRC1M_02890, partial [Methanobacteriaceae archaeon]
LSVILVFVIASLFGLGAISAASPTNTSNIAIANTSTGHILSDDDEEFSGSTNNSVNSVNSIISTSINKTITPSTNINTNNSSINNINNVNTINITNTTNTINTINNTVISGKIANCNNIGYFEGANIEIKSLSNKVLATAISDSNGNYNTSFYSLDNSFNVIASYPGHVSPIANVNVSNSNNSNNNFSANSPNSSNIRYGIANLKLGTLNLTKGSSDTLSYDSNDITVGPGQFIIQIAIKNNAATTATNVWANFTWLTSTIGINLDQNETSNHFIGNISPGQTIYTFYTVDLNSSVIDNSYRNYTITVTGDNTALPQDTVNGSLVATGANSQNRNNIDLIQVSNINPTVGSIISLTIKSSTSSSNFGWVNLPVDYNPSILKAINMTTTYGSNNTNNIYIPNPNTNNFVSVWTFQVIGEGTNIFVPWILDSSGNSYHYNIDSLNLTVIATKKADLAITKLVNNTNPKVNDTVNFTITVTNNGPNNATNVTVTDTINYNNSTNNLINSSELGIIDIISVVPSTGSYNNTSGIWNIGNLSVNSTVSMNITVRIKVTGQIINTANVTATQEDPNLNNNVASAVLSASQKIDDLSVNKVVNNRNPLNGAIVTYTITVVNNGVDTAINSKLSDIFVIPNYSNNSTGNSLILVSATPSFGSFNSSNGIWTIGDLNANSQATLTLNCRVNGTGNITNTVNVSSDTFDPVMSNNINNETLTASPVVDLAVVKTVDNSNPLVGQNITFSIAVKNNGPNNATNVYVFDALANGLIYINSTGTKGTYNNVTGSWFVGNLSTGETVYLNITTLTNSSGNISNTALVIGNEIDLISTNDKSTVTLNSQSNADLAVLKLVDKSNPNNGQIINYIITVSNNGPNTALNTILTDILPTGLIYLSSNPSQGTYNNNTGLWTIGSLSSSTTVTLIITVIANKAGAITNIVNVASDTIDSNPSNNLDVETIFVNPTTDLSIVKYVNASTVHIGEDVLFTLVVSNSGPDNASGVYVNDILSPELIFLSENTSTNSYNNATGIWTIGNLNAGATVTLNILAKVINNGNITNLATVYGTEYDPIIVNNQDSVLVNGQTVANIKVDKYSNRNIYYNGEIVTYIIKASSTGPSIANNVLVNDLLPSGLLFTSAIVPDGTNYNPVTGIWDIGNFNPYTEMTLIITAKAIETGLITNNVNITSTTYDPIVSDNFNSLTINVLPVVDVSAIKQANVTSANIGNTVNFTITVTNSGPNGTSINNSANINNINNINNVNDFINNATGVRLVDILPNGLSFVNYSTSTGTYDPFTGIWNIGILNVGEIETLNITSYINRSSIIITNNAEIIANEFDIDPTNNRAFATINVNNAADLVVAKSVSNNNPLNGETISFNIIAANAGPNTAINTIVSDVLPNINNGLANSGALEFISAISDNGSTNSYDNNTGIWTIVI